jgi:hypothetical protein
MAWLTAALAGYSERAEMGSGAGCSELSILKRTRGLERFAKKEHETLKQGNYKWSLLRITDKGKSRPVLSASFIPSRLLP